MDEYACLPANASEMRERELEMFAEGFRRAIWLYAWWKDGVEKVGMGLKTRLEVNKRLELEMAEVLRYKKEHDGTE